MRILYDPVTVFRECGRYATGKLGRRLARRPMSQETCLLHAMGHGYVRKSSKELCRDSVVFRTTGNWFADGEELLAWWIQSHREVYSCFAHPFTLCKRVFLARLAEKPCTYYPGEPRHAKLPSAMARPASEGIHQQAGSPYDILMKRRLAEWRLWK